MLNTALGVCEPLSNKLPSLFHVCFLLERELQGPSTNWVFRNTHQRAGVPVSGVWVSVPFPDPPVSKSWAVCYSVNTLSWRLLAAVAFLLPIAADSALPPLTA